MRNHLSSALCCHTTSRGEFVSGPFLRLQVLACRCIPICISDHKVCSLSILFLYHLSSYTEIDDIGLEPSTLILTWLCLQKLYFLFEQLFSHGYRDLTLQYLVCSTYSAHDTERPDGILEIQNEGNGPVKALLKMQMLGNSI